MTYHVTCPCGESIEVLASAAGQGVPCAGCGRGVLVPRLSQLREMANLGAFETSAIDTIGRLVAEGRLPAGEVCMISGRPTRDWFEVEVQCEAPYVKKGRMDATSATLVFIFGIWALLFKNRLSGDAHFGRDTRAVVPLRIDREHHAKLALRRSRRKLGRLLRTIPEAVQLFSEYHEAKIIAGRGMIDPKNAAAYVDDLLD